MSTSNKLPRVLYRPHGNSISMERALKQIKELLELYPLEGSPSEDRIQASIEDIETMLICIE